MTWEPIEYRLTGSDPLVCVQWDGLIGKWRILDWPADTTDATFDTAEDAMKYAESIAVAEVEQ